MLKVGQKLWLVHNYSGNRDKEIIISKVGSKWAYSNDIMRKDIKIDVKNLSVMVEGHSTIGQCYLSKEVYEAKKELQKAWSEFHQKIYCARQPENITIEKINQALGILGID